MSVKETLIKAREILATRGINRNGRYINPDTGCLCALGAVRVALGARIVEHEYYQKMFMLLTHDISWHAYEEAAQFLELTLQEEFPDYEYYYVTIWNDLTTTDAQVLELFDKAIARAS